MSDNLGKAALAEAIGTFALIFSGVLAITGAKIAGAPDGFANLASIGLAHGLTIAVMVAALGAISGGHFNPAVTFGFVITGRLAPARGVVYWIAQLVGAALAGFLIVGLFGKDAAGNGTRIWAANVSVGAGIAIEAVTTFFLVLVIFGTAVDPRAPRNVFPLAIGLTVALDIMATGPLTGAAMNPARWFGPAVAAGHWANATGLLGRPAAGRRAGRAASALRPDRIPRRRRTCRKPAGRPAAKRADNGDSDAFRYLPSPARFHAHKWAGLYLFGRTQGGFAVRHNGCAGCQQFLPKPGRFAAGKVAGREVCARICNAKHGLARLLERPRGLQVRQIDAAPGNVRQQHGLGRSGQAGCLRPARRLKEREKAGLTGVRECQAFAPPRHPCRRRSRPPPSRLCPDDARPAAGSTPVPPPQMTWTRRDSSGLSGLRRQFRQA